MSMESFKVSEQAKSQLIQLKRKTGIEHWNVLCRWAFCFSLAEKTVPPDENIVTDSNVELTWRTFGGTEHEIYYALLKQRVFNDGLDVDEKTLSKYFKLHLHRGISYLAGNKSIDTIFDLVKIVSNEKY